MVSVRRGSVAVIGVIVMGVVRVLRLGFHAVPNHKAQGHGGGEEDGGDGEHGPDPRGMIGDVWMRLRGRGGGGGDVQDEEEGG